MAVFIQKNEVGFKRVGVTVNVPNNNVARLMYYLQSVCIAVECEQGSEIRRFTNYENWSYLSIDDQKVLLALCYTFSPDVFDDKVFFHSDVLCGDRSNDFFEISQVRHQLLAAESIIIAGETCKVNKIMTYTMQWMRTNYIDPMQGLAQRIRSVEQPAVTYSPPPRARETPVRRSSASSSRTIYQPTPTRCACTKGCVFGSVCGFLILLAAAITIAVFVMKNK